MKDCKAFPRRLGTRLRCPPFASSTQLCTEVQVRAIGQGKETKGIHIRKNEVKLSLFAVVMILYIDNPKEPSPHHTQKLLELINELSKVSGCKINIQKSAEY